MTSLLIYRTWVCGLLLAIAAPLAPLDLPAQEKASLLKNGGFAEWQDDLPVGWKVEIGAQNANQGPASIVRPIAGPAVLLQGEAKTMLWNLVSQTVAVKAGQSYRLSFEAVVKGIQREGRQFDNCYVGVFVKDGAGKVVDRRLQTVSSAAWAESSLVFRSPAAAGAADVILFLSKTGMLGVKNLRLVAIEAKDSFQILVDDMDRNYSFFELKGTDWKALTGRYRKDAEAARNPDGFAQVVAKMLGELNDIHIWLDLPNKQRVPSFRSSYDANYDYRAMAGALEDVQQFGQGRRSLGLVGRTAQGYGVVVVGGLTADDQAVAQFVAAVRGLLNAPGMIVDLRANAGGAEPIAQQIASLFVDQPREYAKQKRRSGPDHEDLREVGTRSIGPDQKGTFLRPVVCLIGPGCVSSGEGMAMMMKCLPHVTLAGQPTRGASGNPAPVDLPNGVSVYYSRWISLLPDGTPIEGVGVTPDVMIEHRGPGDPTFEAAVKILGQKIAAAN